jgi:hypothetical protein
VGINLPVEAYRRALIDLSIAVKDQDVEDDRTAYMMRQAGWWRVTGCL